MITSGPDNVLEICEIIGIHDKIIKKVEECLPEGDRFDELADLFKLFADSTRVSILWALSEAEMCVCDLCALLRMKQPTISHQLKKLKLSRVVKTRREGKVIFYSLNDQHVRVMLDMGMEHINE